jgi:hypothetical protein
MMTMLTGSEIYKRTAAYEREMTNIRLHAPQWKLLLAFDGQRSLSEIALNSAMPFPDAQGFAEHFLKQGWIEEQPITLEEYLRRANASGTYSGGVIPASVVINEPAGEAKADKPAAPAASPAPSPVTAAPAAPAAPTPTTIEIPPAVKDTPRPAPRGVMRLAAVVDYIVSVAETISLGQLLAYRVFLRVPPEILQSEDIVSIHLIEDTSLVRSEELQKAISSAVQEVLKRPLPDSVFAPA